ncbi:hypothetical protein ACFL54_06145 [Planctomycetota bacterium]
MGAETHDKEVWIGMAHVLPLADNDILDKEAAGAWVNALVLAGSEDDFRNRVQATLEAMQFNVAEIKDAEPYANRTAATLVVKRLRDLAKTAAESGEVHFGSFHCYHREIWVGHIGVVPIAGNEMLEQNARGAWVNAMAMADDEADFCEQVSTALQEMHFEVRALQAVEPLSSRTAQGFVAGHILEMAEETRTAEAVRFGRFHAFEQDIDWNATPQHEPGMMPWMILPLWF